MSNLDKNVNRKKEPSDYTKITINPIEKDKKEKGSWHTNLTNPTQSQILATLVSYFKKIISSFAFKPKHQAPLFDQYNPSDTVSAFKALFLLLSKEDQSHNPDFALQLSTLWHNLLEDCLSSSSSFKDSPDTLLKLKFLISQIQNYPLGEDHTLGYYLSEYAGKEWIPFPFMELLQQLHEEFNTHSSHGTLKDWIELLNQIV